MQATYHITYKTRQHEIRTSRVTITASPYESAAALRLKAVQAAHWKFSDSVYASISAVRVTGRLTSAS